MSFQPKKPRSHGRALRQCRRCGTHRAVIRRADLYICRRCLREIAPDLGFRKLGTRGG